MKKYILVLLTVFCVYGEMLHAQAIGTQLSYIQPTGMYGYVFNPTASAEINYQLGDIEERLKMSFAIGYYALTTTRDTFFTVGIQSGGSGTKALEGYNVWKNVWVVPLGVNIDYKIMDENFSPTVGGDVYFLMMDMIYIHDLSGVIHSETNGGKGAMAVVPRVGMSYEAGNVLLLGGVGYSMGIDEEYGMQTYLKSYLKVCYYFDSSGGNRRRR